MSLDHFKQGFKYFTVSYLNREWNNSYIEKRSSVNRRLYKFNFTIGDKELTPKPRITDSQNLQVLTEQETQYAEAESISDAMDLMLDSQVNSDLASESEQAEEV